MDGNVTALVNALSKYGEIQVVISMAVALVPNWILELNLK
jgi:hypothetical protein